ncbi:MAG: hypothetical protein H6849_05145 [Alphaproteobacteria bacterium]|nr:MAG: hypothetical protein H6849_05145 [Alphaproteobacteria bacterium]
MIKVPCTLVFVKIIFLIGWFFMPLHAAELSKLTRLTKGYLRQSPMTLGIVPSGMKLQSMKSRPWEPMAAAMNAGLRILEHVDHHHHVRVAEIPPTPMLAQDSFSVIDIWLSEFLGSDPCVGVRGMRGFLCVDSPGPLLVLRAREDSDDSLYERF